MENSLKVHMKVNHEGVREFICRICGKEFGIKSVLKNHLETVHTKKHVLEDPIRLPEKRAKKIEMEEPPPKRKRRVVKPVVEEDEDPMEKAKRMIEELVGPRQPTMLEVV